MITWDYEIKKNWKPQNEEGWLWYLERKINYDDWKGLNKLAFKKYLPKLKIPLGKKLMIKAYLKRYAR